MKNAETKWIAAIVVGDTREDCEAKLKEAFAAKCPPTEYSCVIERFYIAPAINDPESCVVVRTGSLMRALVAAMEAK